MATTPGLRPLGLGEILDVGIKLYLRHWRVLIGCVVWVVLPVQVLTVLLTLSIAPEQLDLTSRETVAPGEENAFVASQLTIVALALLGYLFTTAACFKAVADAYLGHEPSARRSLGFALRRLHSLVWYAIVIVIALVIAAAALLVPAIWLSIAWSLAVPALLFERISVFRALGRSFRLVRGRWWRIAITLVVGVFLVSFMGTILQGILLIVPALVSDGNDVVNAFANVVAGTIGSVLTTPFTAAVVTLVYFDQRVRKEGFDLQLLADGLGGERDPDAPLPAPPGFLAPGYTPEQRAQAPYWPPPPGWKPPEPEPAPGVRGWSAPAPPDRAAAPPPAAPDDVPPRAAADDAPPPAAPDDAPPAPASAEEPGAPPADERGWEPPRAPGWPPEPPPRGPGGL